MSASTSARGSSLSSLLAVRLGKRPRVEDGRRLQEAAIQLLEQQQDLCGLLREVEDGAQKPTVSEGISPVMAGSLLVSELRHQATLLGVPVVMLSVRTVLRRLVEIIGPEGEDEKEDTRRELLTSCQRVRLCGLLGSSRELLSQGALCPKLLWQEYRRDQRPPNLEIVYHLHVYNILTLKYVLESDEGARPWLVSGLRALCTWRPPQGEEEAERVQQKVLSMVVGVLVGSGFEPSPEPAAPDKNISLLCCSVLDEMLFWLLDAVDESPSLQSAGGGAELWIQIFSASLCGAAVSAEALQRFFTHSLTQTFTYKPRLKVSDAITLQHKWTFVKASQTLTSLFRKLAVVFSVEQLLCHLQQVLETHEVNWKHVLCFLSTLMVFNSSAQPSLRELLSGLLSSAFESYDLENMITAFLLARQAALEGTSIFSSYSHWFKMSFGSSSGFHATSKKSLVFLLKFLSDLVPFEPPQYLKVHVLHPPYIPMKHRNLLMEYTSLAKTRLSDLKESMEDMGLYEDVSAAGGGGPVEPQSQAVQDVDKAVSLFASTGRISATVMEASIFRRPYFLTRFLPALLIPRMLPVKADAQMCFIEALKKADKIPASQYSAYVESCQRQRQINRSVVCSSTSEDPLEVLRVQLQEFTQLVVDRENGEMAAQLSRISHTLSVVFPGSPDELTEKAVIELHIDRPLSSELHARAVNMILRSFCQCLLDASRANPPNKQNPWASRLVTVLLANTQLLSSLIHRLWDLFQHQLSSLGAAQILGLAVFVVHLHASMSHGPLIQLVPPVLPRPVVCGSCVLWDLQRDSLPQRQQQGYVLSSLYKKLLYLIPRLLPGARRAPDAADGWRDKNQEENLPGLWSSATDTNSSWKETARYLWRHSTFQQLQHVPQYQLLFSEWLVNELRVRRGEDALSDPERQEYQRWACMEHYLCWPEEQGGCGGDMKSLCSHLLSAIMDQKCSDQTKLDLHESATGTCLPDILSRLQELVYEMGVTDLSGGWSDFLFEFVSGRCSSTLSSAPLGLSSELSLQQTLHTWNRVLLALPAVLCVQVQVEGGRVALDCNKLIEHVNQHQRKACSPAGLLPRHVTAHFLRGVLFASVRCRCPTTEVNKAWSQISMDCPLLLTSTVHWWECLSPGLMSLWGRLCDAELLPEQLQLLTNCQHWAHSSVKGPSWLPMPRAPALLLASSLHCAWRGGGGDKQASSEALNMLRREHGSQHRQVLVFLLFLCVKDYLSALLCPQVSDPVYCPVQISFSGKMLPLTESLCSDLLSVLVDSADWLLIFKPSDQGVYQSVTKVTSEEFTRLMPWAFYSLLLQQSAELLQRATRCPGFLHTAVLSYIHLLQLFLEGRTPPPNVGASEEQLEPSQVLRCAKQFVLRAISQMSPAALSSAQLRQLDSQCSDLDPEVAALSVHLHPQTLSPEMDFLSSSVDSH